MLAGTSTIRSISDVNKDNVRDVNDINYVPPGWDDWQALFEPSTSWMYNFAINDNGVFAVHGSTETEYQTDVNSRGGRRTSFENPRR